MNRHVAAGLTIAGLIAATAIAAPELARAQGQSGKQVIVVKELKHVHTPNLRDMKQIPPATGLEQEVPVHRPKPAHARASQGTVDQALQSEAGPLVSTTNGLNFLGVGVGFEGTTGDEYAPPDTNGSAGATQYVQWVNVSFAVFNKATGAVEEGPVSGSTLWQPIGGSCFAYNSGDIIAQYDKQAQRWVMMQPVFTSPYYLCVAVSQTSDATGQYNLYQFPTPSNGFPDYPKLAVWPDGYYVSYNDFGTNGNSYQGGYACALDRTSMLAGNAATMQCFNSGYPSLLPSDLDGDSGAPGSTLAPPAGSPNYYSDFSSTSSLNLFQFHVDWTNPSNSTFTGPSVIPVDSFSEACGGGVCIPQPNTNEQLDSLGDRLMYRFAYRNFGSYESLVISQSVDTGSGNTGVRWYEIRSPGSNPAVYQQGTFAPDANYRWMPSIAEDQKGDIAVGYSESNSGIYPFIEYTGRLSTDPLGTMESEATIVNGSGSQLPSLDRWGDYSNMSVDPSDDCTFWYTTEYLQNSGTFNWSTQVAYFSFPGCAAPPTPNFALSPTPSSQTVSQGSGTSFTINATPSDGYTGNVTLSVTTALPGGMTVGFAPNPADITSSGAVNSTLTVNTTSATPANTYLLTVSGTDGTLTNTTQVSVTVQGPPPDFTITESPSTLGVPPGSSGNYTVTIGSVNSFSGTVSFSVSGLPSRVSGSFSPSTVTGSGSTTLKITANSKATTGTHTITITGTSGSLSHPVNATLVIGTVPTPAFSIAGSPGSQTVTQGGNTSYTITASPSNGYTGNVNLSATGLPTGANATFNPTPVDITGSGSVSSTMMVTTGISTPPGSYTVTVTGNDGTTSHNTTVTLVVQSVGNFTVTVSPGSQSVSPGSSTQYMVTITGSGGFTGTVNLSVSGLPSKATGSFSPSSVAGSGTSTLTVSTNRKTPKATSTLTVTGTSGSLTYTATTGLTVN